MSGLHELFQMAHIFGGAHFKCKAWVDNWFADGLFVLDWYPLLIYGGTAATTYFDSDLFYLGVSCITYVGAAINDLLNEVFDEYGPQGSSCFYARQMPSHGSQLVTEFVIMFLCLGLYRRYLPDTWTLVGSFLIVYAIYFERLYRNVDTVGQLYSGIGLGGAVAIVGFNVLYYILTRWGDAITDSCISYFFNLKNDYFGKAHEDHLYKENQKSRNQKKKKKNPSSSYQIKRTTRDQPLFEALSTLQAQSPLRLIVERPEQHTYELDTALHVP